jgi:hypothetical protein
MFLRRTVAELYSRNIFENLLDVMCMKEDDDGDRNSQRESVGE